MATLTLVVGLPGVGKSTVAELIAKKTGAVIVNTDIVRRDLFPVNRTYSPDETRQVVEEIHGRVKKYLQEGKRVIVDSLMAEQKARDYYIDLAAKFEIEYKIILITANESVVRERIDTRLKHGADKSEANFQTYLMYKARFEPVEGKHIVIDNSGDLDALKQKIRSICT